MGSDELWPHMWRVEGIHSGGVTQLEWFECSCGKAGDQRDPNGAGENWAYLWKEAAEHMVDVGQITSALTEPGPYAGGDGAHPSNPLWAFRSDLSAETRSQTRRDWGIPDPRS
jgi:hypothetical protein